MHLDRQKILEKYKSYNITVDEAKIKKAVEFAIKYHGIQQGSVASTKVAREELVKVRF